MSAQPHSRPKPINVAQATAEFLTELHTPRPDRALARLEASAGSLPSEVVHALIRAASYVHDLSPLATRRLTNLWRNIGHPPLKPNGTARRVVLLSDATVDQLADPLRLFSATRGVDLEVSVAAFDSVEQEVFGPRSPIYESRPDFVVLMLSYDWLNRYLGEGLFVELRALDVCKAAIEGIVAALCERTEANVLVCTAGHGAFPPPSGFVRLDDRIGRRVAAVELNAWLSKLANTRVSVLDAETAIFLAGGKAATGGRSYFLAKMPQEPEGTVLVSREVATAIASWCGRTHRVLATDWDNTLWGGELAELGPFEIVCGHDPGDAHAYRLVQKFILGLRGAGVMLAAVSRNDPSLVTEIDENPDLPVSAEVFSSIQVAHRPKSDSIGRVCEDLGLGPEHVVFLDDSLFELAEVLTNQPHVDIIKAGPDPETTLLRLCRNRLFNEATVTPADLARHQAARALKSQRELRTRFSSHTEFLASIDIGLTFSGYEASTRTRVLQLIQKSNQFNLTTRRHREADLERLIAEGARVFVVSYDDSFGPQGIIAVVILCPRDGGFEIDTWLMSCRVLNRTVEQGTFCWLYRHLGQPMLRGEYVATQKNALVRDLYPELGFKSAQRPSSGDATCWQFDAGDPANLPTHQIKRFTVQGCQT